MINNVFVSNEHGCVYAIVKDIDSDGDFLIQTPQFADGSYDPDQDNWAEVDEMALLGEDQSVRDHVELVWATLRLDQETPIGEAYGG